MHLMYFTEQPMSAYPEGEGRDFGATALMFSNRFFDPVAGSRLYNEYLEHYRLAVVEKAGHFVDMEQPEALAKLISEFAAGS